MYAYVICLKPYSKFTANWFVYKKLVNYIIYTHKIESAHCKIASKVLKFEFFLIMGIYLHPWEINSIIMMILIIISFRYCCCLYLGSRKNWIGYSPEKCAPTREWTAMERVTSACTWTPNAANSSNTGKNARLVNSRESIYFRFSKSILFILTLSLINCVYCFTVDPVTNQMQISSNHNASANNTDTTNGPIANR